MRGFQLGLVLALTLAGAAAYAQTPAAAPAAAAPAMSISCKDGTTVTAASRRGACRGHGGIQPASASSSVATPAPASSAAVPATAPPAVAASVTPAAPKTTAPAATPKPATPVAQTPTNPADVWVNTRSKIYHCPGSPRYGKTKVGSFMSEAAAKAAGDRPAANKTCVAAS